MSEKPGKTYNFFRLQCTNFFLPNHSSLNISREQIHDHGGDHVKNPTNKQQNKMSAPPPRPNGGPPPPTYDDGAATTTKKKKKNEPKSGIDAIIPSARIAPARPAGSKPAFQPQGAAAQQMGGGRRGTVTGLQQKRGGPPGKAPPDHAPPIAASTTPGQVTWFLEMIVFVDTMKYIYTRASYIYSTVSWNTLFIYFFFGNTCSC